MKQPPRDLGRPGRAFWRAVNAAYELHQGEQRILIEAARTVDEIESLRAALRDAPAMVAGSTGQPRPHPLFEELRRHRDTLSRLVVALRIPYEDQEEGESPSVSSARRAAQIRWQGGGRGGEATA